MFLGSIRGRALKKISLGSITIFMATILPVNDIWYDDHSLIIFLILLNNGG